MNEGSSGIAPDRYCRDIESYLCRKNDGHLIRIVGPAFEQVCGWAARGVPLAVACRGIDRYFERYYAKGRRRRPVRIEFCEADVLDVFDEWRRAVGITAANAGEGAESADEESVRRVGSLPAHLERVVARLTALRAGEDRSLDVVADALIRELDTVRAGARQLRGGSRENLLNRYGDVTEDGDYSSPIANPTRRFFTMLGTLVAGRISVALAAQSALKAGLTIAVRYGASRKQFGSSEGHEVPILDYLTHQRRLFPAIATAYAFDFALKSLVGRFVAAIESGHDADAEYRRVEADAAGLKALVTWHTIGGLQAARECCGGQGFLAVNRIAQLRADTDVTTTFEGDNTVLLQLVAKGLLTDYRQQFHAAGARGILRYLGRRASARLARVNPVLARRTDEEHLRDPDFQLGVLRYREERLLGSAARRLKHRIEAGADGFGALIECQDHLLALARAHVERRTLEEFARGTDNAEPGLRPVLHRLRELFALSVLEREEGWLLAHGVFEGAKAEAVRALVNQSCRELRPHAVALVNAFGIPDEILGAPIAMAGAP